MGEGKKAGVIGYNSHFRAVIACLIKNSLLKLSLYIYPDLLHIRDLNPEYGPLAAERGCGSP
jgi:hypothetical protein